MVAYRLRRVKGSGVLFVLLLNLLVFSYNQSALGSLVNLVVRNNSRDYTDDHSSGLMVTAGSPWLLTVITATLSDFIPKLLYPFAGWLADAKLGRYKVMRYSLWVMWVGSVLLILTSILSYVLSLNGVTERDIQHTVLPISIIIYIVNIIGLAGYHVNVIPFGIDQMEGPSGEQIASYIHWYYFTRNLNFGVIAQVAFQSDLSCRSKQDVEACNMYLLLIQSAFLAAALCLDFLFSSKLHKDAKIHNPIKKVKAISAFVFRHGQPVGQRRAHTFTYEAPPVRSDFAKLSYGGPFEDDKVEDVKSFWRIVMFLLAGQVGGFLVQTGYYNYPSFFEHMKSNNMGIPHCALEYLITSDLGNVLFIVICIALYEFLVYPFVRNYIPSTKVRIGVGIIVCLFGMIALLAIDIAGHAVTPGKAECMFFDDPSTSSVKISIHPFYLILVILIMAIGEMLALISTFEFIVAQSPYGMRGLILGIWFMIYGVTVGFLSIMLTAFSLGYRKVNVRQPSCGTLYIAGVVALGCVGTLVYFGAAWLYKGRQRGGQVDINHQTILEGYYESGRVNSNTFAGTPVPINHHYQGL